MVPLLRVVSVEIDLIIELVRGHFELVFLTITLATVLVIGTSPAPLLSRSVFSIAADTFQPWSL